MSEDCISRNDTIEWFKRVTVTDGITFETGFRQILTDIQNMPSVQPMRPKGKWVSAKVGKLFPSNDYKCSRCGNVLNFDGVNAGRGDANFCPNCGADMRGE